MARTDAQVILDASAAIASAEVRLGGRDSMIVLVQAEGIGSGDTLTPEGTLNGVDWYTIEGVKTTDRTDIASIAADGMYRFECFGMTAFRVTKVGTAGTVVATARAVKA